MKTETSADALNIKNLVIEYVTADGVVHAVNNINLRIRKQCSMGLVGETGAGKTSTALAAMSLIPSPPGVVRSGEICVNG